MTKIKKKNKDKGKKSFVVWMTVIGTLLVGSYAGFLGWRSRPPKHPTLLHPPFRKGGMEGFTGRPGGEIEAEVVDPVCGMKVKPPAEGHVEYLGNRYYFCSIVCKKGFEKEPGKYLE